MASDAPHFTWDPDKNEINKKKHGIDFTEACSVFSDEDAKMIGDPDHSGDEDRFVIMGWSMKYRLLVVCHCYREDDDEIRIITARKANKHEKTYYKSKG